MNTRQKSILKLVIFTSVLGQIATDVYLPSLPDLAELFSIEIELIKTSVSIFFFGYAFSQIICGPLSDEFGRKIFMVAGIIIFGTGCWLAGHSNTVEMLMLSRVIQGLGSGCFGVANRAILFDSFTGIDYSRSISIVAIVMAVSPMIAPSLGGILHEWFGWQSIFLFMQAYAFILCMFLINKLPETINSSANTTISKDYKQFLVKLIFRYKEILSVKQFWIYSLINMLGFAAFIFYLGSSSFIIQDQLGYSSIEFGKFISLISLGYISGSLISNRLISRVSRSKIIYLGNTLQLVAVTIHFFIYNLDVNPLVLILIPMILFVLGTGMINPNSTAILVSGFPKNAATAAAAMGTVMTFGTFCITSLLFLFFSNTSLLLGYNLLLFAISIKALISLESFNLVQIYSDNSNPGR